MIYTETPIPHDLAAYVAAIWTLDCGGKAGDQIIHEAVPDGCIELILRTRGDSYWKRPQSELFATGLSEQPASLRFSGDASFIGIRFWPWTWNRLGPVHCKSFKDDWIAVATEAPVAAALKTSVDILGILNLQTAALGSQLIGSGLLKATNVSDAVSLSGCNPRTIQRWCARELGMTPRQYIRLLRFGRAVYAIQHDDETLADHAAAIGYADQAHMARTFRSLAGDVTNKVRKRALGPFI